MGRILVASSAVDMVNDGYDRLGMVYEARGDNKQAAHYYRKVIDFVRAHPDQYEPAFETTFQRLVQNLTRRPAIDGSRPKKSAQWVCWTFAVIAGDPESLLRLYLNAVTR